MNGENQKAQDDHAATTQPVTPVEPATPPAPSLASDQPQSPWTVAGLSQSGMPVDAPSYDAPEPMPSPEVNWTASEFIAHDKSPMWYLGLGGSTAVLIIFAIFVMHDVVAVVMISLIAVLFGAVASHKPRTLPYSIDATGITIGKKTFSYGEFKSFGVVREEAFSNVTLVPLKRFSPPLSIYYPPEEEEAIIQALSAYLPMSPIRPDFIDGIVRRLHL